MNPLFVPLLGGAGFVALITLLLPHIARPNVFFGVHVAPGFRRAPEARPILRQYRLGVVLSTALLLLFFRSLPPHALTIAIPALPITQILLASAFFIRANRQARVFFTPQSGLREADVSGGNRLPGFFWLVVVPYAVLGAVAFYLHQHWAAIPPRFPVHWDINGQVNGWSTKTFRGVYGPLFFGVGIITVTLGGGIIAFFGARNSATRRTVLAILVAASFLLAVTFAIAGLLPLYRAPLWIPLALGGVFVVCILVWTFRKANEPDAETEVTPDSSWYAGGYFYRNPRDPALFVQKRVGYGYTLNFGNRWSWAFLIGFFATIIAMISLVARVQR